MPMDMRDKLLAAAARVYAELGYRGATTRRIAQEAGVNEITLFRHFGSKDALILEALRREDVGHCCPTLPDEPAEPERELTAWCRGHFEFLFERRSLIRTCMGEMAERPDVGRSATRVPLHAAMVLRTYLGRLRDRGLADADADLEAATWMLLSTLFSHAMWHDVLPPPDDRTLDEELSACVRIVLRGLGVDTAPADDARPAAAKPGRVRTGARAKPRRRGTRSK